MSTSSNQNVPLGRCKEINVIYFIDANKTRSFKMSLTKFIGLALTVGLVFCWAIASGFWVYVNAMHASSLRQRLRDSLSTIFEYQSRYDNIYESAYPDQTKQKKDSLLANLKEHADDNQELKKLQTDQQIQEKFKSLYESINQSEMEINLKVHEQSIDWPVKIEDAVLYKEKNRPGYELNFAIRNVKSPLKSDGYIWAVATFVTTRGDKFYVGAPSGIVLDGNGKPVDQLKNLEYYNIRYYKAKNLTFLPPQDEKAFIIHITVGMTDKKRNESTVFDIPVQPEIDSANLPVINLLNKQHDAISNDIKGGEVARSSDTKIDNKN